MSKFVHTTGGLLQLVHEPVTEKDVEAVLKFAIKLGYTEAEEQLKLLKKNNVVSRNIRDTSNSNRGTSSLK